MTRARDASRAARPLGPRLAGALAVAIVVAYVLGAAAGLWSVLAGAGSGAGVPPGLPSAVADLLLVTVPVVGAVIVSRHPRHVIGWLLLATALLLTLGNVAGPLIRYQLETPGEPSAIATVALWFSSWAFFPTLILGLVLVPLLFPDGRPPSRRWWPVVWAAAVLMFFDVLQKGFAYRLVARDWAPDGVERVTYYEVANPLAIPGLPLTGTAEIVAAAVIGPVTLAVIVAAWLAPIVRFRRGVGLERQQMKWLALVVGALPVVLLVVFLADNVLGAPTYTVSQSPFVWLAAVPVAIGVAILHHGLYEIDRIISRTVSYGLVVAVLGGVYAAGVVGLGTAVSAVTGQEDNDLVAAASVLAVVALFRPVRSRVQRTVDRRFNRSGYEAGLTVDAFTQQLRDDVDLATIRRDVARTAASVLEPTHVSLWLVADRDSSAPASPPPSRRP